jgi:hypothetical protein
MVKMLGLRIGDLGEDRSPLHYLRRTDSCDTSCEKEGGTDGRNSVCPNSRADMMLCKHSQDDQMIIRRA